MHAKESVMLENCRNDSFITKIENNSKPKKKKQGGGAQTTNFKSGGI